ncbi:MAG: acyltransferase [Deltaproteobacteria bacterium]|nr:acyltransferase [Deltaproteobacteria bacterium]
MSIRETAKASIVAAARAAMMPLWVAYEAESRVLGADKRDRALQSYAQILAAIPGLTGEYARKGFYQRALRRCSDSCCISYGTVFSHADAWIGEAVYIGMRCSLGMVRLEDHVTIGSNVDILSGKGQHGFDDPDTPIQQQGGHYEVVTIGENTWIGNGSVVLADIGPKCVIAAGSVVVKPIPAGAIAGGNPAKVIKMRPGFG